MGKRGAKGAEGFFGKSIRNQGIENDNHSKIHIHLRYCGCSGQCLHRANTCNLAPEKHAAWPICDRIQAALPTELLQVKLTYIGEYQRDLLVSGTGPRYQKVLSTLRKGIYGG